MLATIFELLYTYLLMLNRDGRPPSIRRLAAELGIGYRTVILRIQSACEMGVLEIAERKMGNTAAGNWFRLTQHGADVFSQAVDGVIPLLWSNIVALSPNKNARPSGAKYIKQTAYRYRESRRELIDIAAAVQSRRDRETSAQ